MADVVAPKLCRLPPVSPNLLYVGHGSRNSFSWPSSHTPGMSSHLPQQQGPGFRWICRTAQKRGVYQRPNPVPSSPLPTQTGRAPQSRVTGMTQGLKALPPEAQKQTMQRKGAFKNRTEKLPWKDCFLFAPKLARSLALFPWTPASSCLKPSTNSLLKS